MSPGNPHLKQHELSINGTWSAPQQNRLMISQSSSTRPLLSSSLSIAQQILHLPRSLPLRDVIYSINNASSCINSRTSFVHLSYDSTLASFSCSSNSNTSFRF